jgi:uncharacterized membrane protein
MTHKNNIENILRKLNIKISKSGLKKIIWHPSYPSVVCFLDTLDEFKVKNQVVKLHSNQLKELELPAIALCKENEDEYFVLLKDISETNIIYFDTEKGNIKENLESFQKKWDGLILLLSIDEDSGEPNYVEKKRKEFLTNIETYLSYAFLLVIILLTSTTFLNFSNFILWGILAIGFIFSLILIVNEFGEKNNFINKLCHFNKKIDCDTVLQSDVSKIFGWLSWVEIGLFYFSGSLLSLSISLQFHSIQSVLPLLLLINSLAIPFTAYFLYYQSAVIKKWCSLCLSIQIVILSEFLFLLTNKVRYSELPDYSFQTTSIYLTAFLIPIIIWFLVKQQFQKNRELYSIEKESYSLKRNTVLFKALLNQEKKVSISELPNEIRLGNPEASITLTMISNPYCIPCSDAHKEVMELLNFYDDDVNVIIRFVSVNKEHDVVINHILNLASDEKIGNVLHDWYMTRNYGKWSQKHKISNICMLDNYANLWAKQTDFNSTPTFFLNGKKIVSPFSIYDLKFHLRELIENIS